MSLEGIILLIEDFGPKDHLGSGEVIIPRPDAWRAKAVKSEAEKCDFETLR